MSRGLGDVYKRQQYALVRGSYCTPQHSYCRHAVLIRTRDVSSPFCDFIAVKPLFNAMPGWGAVQETSVICCVRLPCGRICFCCVYLSFCLVGSFYCNAQKQRPNRWQLTHKLTVVFTFLPAIFWLFVCFFAGIYGTYSHMLWLMSDSCKEWIQIKQQSRMEWNRAF